MIKKILTFVVFFFFISASQVFATELLEARVVKITSEGKESFQDSLVRYQELELEVTRGEDKGERIEVKNTESSLGMIGINYRYIGNYQLPEHSAFGATFKHMINIYSYCPPQPRPLF